LNSGKKQGKPSYLDPSVLAEVKKTKRGAGGERGGYDEKYDEAVAFVAEMAGFHLPHPKRFRIGYNRAARIVEKMEEEGVVGPSDGVKARRVLVEKD